MPRIVPLQLLKCLKVLLDYNGGILSESEVKRLAGLMTKYSKKLVSKCIYVQILKCTKTELLGEFMGAGGWTLVHMWLNDAIRAMNWPLVQEILELLLLCPVDVDRLKSNSAPKLVRGLCKDGGIEGVRILAKRLVEQWLKVVTADANLGNPNSVSVNPQIQASATTMPPQAAVLQTPASVTAPITSATSTTKATAAANLRQKTTSITQNGSIDSKPSKQYEMEQDPLADVPSDVPPVPSYGPTPAQKKASEAGLVYKIVVKDGQQVLTKVDTTSVKVQQQQQIKTEYAGNEVKQKENEKENVEADEEEDERERDTEEDEQVEAIKDDVVNIDQPVAAHKENKEVVESLAKSEKDAESSEEEKARTVKKTEKRNDIVKTIVEQIKPEELKEKTEKKMERKSSKDSKESKSKEKEKEKEREKEKEKRSDKDKERKSSSSSGHKSSSSSSNHKSSTKNSSSSSSTSSSVSKSKSTPSSSSSHRSSSDKYRSGSDKDKERTSSSTSSSKDKDRSNNSSNSSSSKHKSSSSKPTSSSSTSSSSSSNKERNRDKDKEKNSSANSSSSTALSKKEKDNIQAEKDKETLASMTKQPSLDKLGKIPKKLKESLPDSAEDNSNSSSTKPPPTTSITIPSKKASMSIEIRRDSEKAKTVKTYKSQFRSHGLNEEAPPPPSRKGLKKPTSTSSPGTSIPSSLPSSSLKRASPPHSSSELPIEKKAKLDIAAMVNNAVGTEKPGAIKLIAAKKIQTLVETNIFSDALSAATGPKKATKRKRPTTPRDGPSPPTSPEAPKVAPLKFYQDTLDENKAEDKSPSVDQKSADESPKDDGGTAIGTDENGNATEDDDDIPLKKVKEDIEQKVLKEQKAAVTSSTIDITSSSDTEENEKTLVDDQTISQDSPPEPKKPGPGCGPNGPPGVLMLHHRRKGPKKKLCWRPQEQLEQIRYFELDETERCNVTKNFMDMKNMERFSERDAINMSRRGFNHEDNMEPQTGWKSLFMIDDVPPHPDGNQSKERKVQADREQTTLRALYFSHSMIPDTPTEAELEPHFPHDIPVIPLDDITGNPDAVNDFTSMPWPEPKGSPKHGDSGMGGLEGLGDPADMFGNVVTPFNPFISRYAGSGGAPTGIPTQQVPTMQAGPPSGGWQGPNGPMPNGMMGPSAVPMMGPGIGNPFAGPMPSSPVMEMGPNGPMGPGPMSGPSPNFMGGRNQFGPGGPPGPNQYGPGGPQFGPGGYNGPPNFGHMGPGGPMGPGPMGPGPMMNGMGPNHMSGPPNGGPMMSGPNGPGPRSGNNRNTNGNNWRSGGSKYSDNNNGGNNGSWRPAGTGQNRNNDWMRENSHSNNGICKGFMRGHCRLGKSCKYIHPKSKRI